MSEYQQSLAALASAAPPEGNGDLATIAWQHIREDIIGGKFAPGTRLRIALLRNIYGIGATPLREALSRLVSERLVVSMDRRGFAVAPISLKELRELTNLRKLLEKEALRQSLENGDEKWEANVVSSIYRLGRQHERIQAGDLEAIDGWEQLNQEFHETLVAACDAPFLLHFRQTVYLYLKRYRQICLSLTSPSRDVHLEHVAMQRAAISRNYELLCTLTDEHLERTYQRIAESGALEEEPVHK
ncbi:GntR family transcriptional regulator [Pusillimonas noertemannii]|uniref:GntR family transcriptional regulator n=1 Tax=Pusillimonas noertemannii TaxID=305977 RepID=A0A2U1CH16_9BURK|nr:FCD domain-containing protein [Pusillimonas noertemannii]NYT68211.1 FCD domain-containing protein [Pusillimonas noertemannii]PVY60181.1 GntR family transcriptional regulator [Pusillimonas noertemannii]TFL10293.1 FCD domain-containing protein [Pusillimonas noertemannii]